MYSSYLGQELARTRINDMLARAEASRHAAAASKPGPAAGDPASRQSCA
jgi:hypothetical protein